MWVDELTFNARRARYSWEFPGWTIFWPFSFVFGYFPDFLWLFVPSGVVGMVGHFPTLGGDVWRVMALCVLCC